MTFSQHGTALFPHGHMSPLRLRGHGSRDRPRCEAIVLCRTVWACSCTMPAGQGRVFNEYTNWYLDLHNDLMCCLYAMG